MRYVARRGLRLGLSALALVPFAAGLFAGGVVSVALWAWAATVAGWQQGRG